MEHFVSKMVNLRGYFFSFWKNYGAVVDLGLKLFFAFYDSDLHSD